MRITFSFLLVFLSLLSQAQFHDWPMWRYDYNRSASTPEQLADKLYLQWKVKYSARTPVWDDPLNQNLMQFDRIFEPIVADNKIFLGFNDKDKVIAALEFNVSRGNPGFDSNGILTWCRNTGAYALAADLIGYRTPQFETRRDYNNDGNNWAATSDDTWMLPFVDAVYGTDFAGNAFDPPRLWEHGKNAGWAYVLPF